MRADAIAYGKDYRSIAMLDRLELAHHFLEHEGRCKMNGRYCRHNRCPLAGQCMGVDRLDWAWKQINAEENNQGRCNSIW